MKNILYYQDFIKVDNQIIGPEIKKLFEIITPENQCFDLVSIYDFKNNKIKNESVLAINLSLDIKVTEPDLKEAFGDSFKCVETFSEQIEFFKSYTPVPPEIYFSEIDYIETEYYELPYYEWYLLSNKLHIFLTKK